VRELLQKEHELFKDQHKKIMDKVEDKEQNLHKQSAAELIEYFRKQRESSNQSTSADDKKDNVLI
jgi:hypothetical protein